MSFIDHCRVDGCGDPYYCKGLCERHWKQMRRHGRIVRRLREDRPEMRLCTAPGCDEKHSAKGYCVAHYSQVKRHGRITNPAPPRRPRKEVAA
jgi:hypothetical protein